MNSNKALKGLLCCAGDTDGECKDCPYDVGDGSICIKNMLHDIIRHIEAMKHKETALKAQCKELQNEIEKLNKKTNN